MEKIYTTLDAYLAGFLTLRHHFPNLVQQGNKIVFSFSGTDALYQDIQEYNAGAIVEALRLAMAIKTLKSQIHSLRKNKENYYGQAENPRPFR
jgi:hypothetical protein